MMTSTTAEQARNAIESAREYGTPLKMLDSQIELAVEAIIEDLTGRRGIKHEWHQIDQDIQNEIRYVWGCIIESVLVDAGARED